VDSLYLDPIYKGGTSPSTAFGVPMLVFILGAVSFGQVALIVFLAGGLPATIAVGVLAISCYGWARRISKFDDQRLLQMVLRVRMRMSQRYSRPSWGAVSFSPFSRRK
jgi:type IV secretory pathway VirB3-like protein